MQNPRTWLQGEVGQWEQEGLISAEQARGILARYAEPAASRGVPWGVIIFSCLGAVVVGLGLILLLAYNWAAIPKAGKLAIVFGSLALAHLTGLRLLWGANERLRPLGEGIGLLGTMLFGAGIWLVAQIYHINEHYPNGFLFWGLGAFGMAWAVPSIPQAILAAVLLTIWSGAERGGFSTPVWQVLPLLGLLGWLAWQRRSRLLLGVLIPALLVAYGFNLPENQQQTAWMLFSVLSSLAALCLAGAYLLRQGTAFPEGAPVLLFYGGSVFLVMLYLLSFPSLASDFLCRHNTTTHVAELLYVYLPLTGALAAWGAVWRLRMRSSEAQQAGFSGLELALIPLTVLLASLYQLLQEDGAGQWMVAGPFNLVFLGIAGSLMARGCRDGALAPTVWGSILLVLLIVARYFDLFESQLTRGIIFVVVGAILLAEGYLYSRAKRQRIEGGAQ